MLFPPRFISPKGSSHFRDCILAVFFLLAFSAPLSHAANPTKLGDLDGDGQLTVYDLTRLRAHIRDTTPLAANLVPFADVTEDGFINEDDSVSLINTITGASSAKTLPLASIRDSSPFAGEGNVALTREVAVRFTMPLAMDTALTTWNANTQTPGTFYAEGGGRKILSRVDLSGDHNKATLFFLEPVPASTRITVTFDGSGLKDLLGRQIDPDGDGTAAGAVTFTYDTSPITAVPGTSIVGHVYASEKAANGSNTPLQGALVRVVGSETLFTHTAADGSFSLNPCPAGRFFVEVDGRTCSVSNFPDGAYYPYINKPWEALPGKADNLAAGTGVIYLPLIPANTLKPVSATVETTVTFAPSAIAGNPALAGVEIYVPPNSLFADDGTRGGKVGLAPVASDRLPEPLPPGLKHALDISIQTDGATNFDQPVPVKFPNLPDPVTGIKLKPGEKSALWSYNHNKGSWEIGGPMTVTDDGDFIVTDVGVGIRQPGWHGTMPGVPGETGGVDAGDPPPPDCPDPTDRDAVLNSPYRVKKEGAVPPNGCGPESGWKRFAMAVLLLPYQLIFEGSCNAHDVGYGSYVPKELFAAHKSAVDTNFLNNMNDDIDGSILLIPVAPQLKAAAFGYYQAVKRIGQEFYLNAQFEVSTLDCPKESRFRSKQLVQKPIKRKLQYVLQEQFANESLRGMTLDDGRIYGLILAPNSFYRYSVADPGGRLIGHDSFFTNGSGTPVKIDTIYIKPDSSPDADKDEISDDMELVMGTNPVNPDTDADGVNDGAEFKQGTDPLSGLAVVSGVFSTIATPGQSKDIAAQNSSAILADGSEGVSVFNVANSLNPVRTGQFRLSGSTESVTLDGTLAAATGTNLSLLDLSDLSAVRLTKELSLGGTPVCVTSAGGIAYAGLSNGQVVAVDMAAGVELERLQVTNSAIADVVFVGDVLYARSSSRVFAISLATGGMTLGSSVAVNGTAGGGSRLRLNAGEGLLYAPNQRGYTILSLTNPLAPTVQQVISTQQFGWKQMVPTGSGLGVAAMSAFGADADISLYNIGADGKGSQFLTTFVTPGTTEAVSIYNGLAYVADGAAGLTIVNYKAYDALGVPPTINIKTGFPSVSGALQAEEGKLGRMSAVVADDVQVRNVEFYVDDQLVNTDGNFPFEHRFVTPLRSQAAAAVAAANSAIDKLNSPACCGGQVSSEDVAALVRAAEAAKDVPPKTTFTLRAKATDTGGNSTWSETLTINLVADATPPRVVKFLPANGSLTGKLRVFNAVFSEPIDNATLNSATFAVTGTGPDGLFGTSDDILSTGGALSYRDSNNSAFLNFADDLTPGLYRLNVRQPLADLAGNSIAADVFSQIRVFSFSDRDGDGVPDDVESLLGLNPDNPDTNGNGIPDGREDFDNDGLINTAEIFIGTDPTDSDSNNNGIPDGQEDADGDKLNNIREFLAGTDPNKADTDGDGWNDETEVTGKSNPLDPNSRPLGFIASVPASYLLRVGDPVDGLLGRSSVIARPPVQLARLASDPNSPNGGLGSAAFISRPPLYLARLSASQSGPNGGSGAASVIAQPPVFVSRLSTVGGNGSSTGAASIIATPSVTTTRLDAAGAIISKPPVTIQNGTP